MEVVTLVHGTFAPRARWTRPESALSTALSAVGCHVTRFGWSGGNSHRARAVAADGLHRHLERLLAVHPGARHWVVAHSHGGNVALHAADRLRGGARRAPVSTITLATPFLHAHVRRPEQWALSLIAMFGIGLLFFGGSAAAEGPASAADWLLVAGAGLTALMLVLCAIGAGLHRHRLGRGWRERLAAGIQAPAPRDGELVIVRAAKDEATAALIIGQVLGLLGGAVTRILTSVELWLVLILVPGAVIVVSDLASRDTGLGVTLMIYGFLVPGLVTAAVVPVMVLPALVFGVDGPFAAAVTSCSAEAAPPGSARLLQLEPRTGGRGLAHSSLYDDETVIRHVVSVITDPPAAARSRAPQAAGEPPATRAGKTVGKRRRRRPS